MGREKNFTTKCLLWKAWIFNLKTFIEVSFLFSTVKLYDFLIICRTKWQYLFTYSWITRKINTFHGTRRLFFLNFLCSHFLFHIPLVLEYGQIIVRHFRIIFKVKLNIFKRIISLFTIWMMDFIEFEFKL